MDKAVIHKNIPVIKPSDTFDRALKVLREMRLDGLPVVKQRKLLGVLLESDIEYHIQLENGGLDQRVDTFHFESLVTVNQDEHPYEVMKLFDRVPYSFLPVVDNDKNYLGIIFKEDVFDELNEIFRIFEEGTVMEFEVPATQFRLSEMIKMIEQNDAKVISIASRPSSTTPTAQVVTTKVEARDPFRLQQTMEKFGYPIIYSSSSSVDYLDDYAHKAQELLRYLEI
ncbi:MAG: CBS domain-containing protein [Chlorobiales bacterium]|jgi:acetoin utilization protein AcuB|nr:CBS domain-containing protein [Chlorobiales bacterium]